MVAVQGLVFEYPNCRALDDVGFQLPARSITALVGPNGAGKTTLLRCLCGLDVPSAGSMSLAGVDVLASPRVAHRQLGYLADNFGLYVQLSVRRCLLYAGRSRGMGEAELPERIATVSRQLGLEALLAQPAGALSRGQRQRLAIGQAIMHRPKVLLLDEPASGLDPESRATLSALLRHLRDEGMTLLVSSHILAELEEYCTGMLILQRGSIVEHSRLQDAAAGPAPQCILRIRLAADCADFAGLLSAAGAEVLQADSRSALVVHEAASSAQALLLARIVEAGASVCQFAVEPETLQQAYLQAMSAKAPH